MKQMRRCVPEGPDVGGLSGWRKGLGTKEKEVFDMYSDAIKFSLIPSTLREFSMSPF